MAGPPLRRLPNCPVPSYSIDGGLAIPESDKECLGFLSSLSLTYFLAIAEELLFWRSSNYYPVPAGLPVRPRAARAKSDSSSFPGCRSYQCFAVQTFLIVAGVGLSSLLAYSALMSQAAASLSSSFLSLLPCCRAGDEGTGREQSLSQENALTPALSNFCGSSCFFCFCMVIHPWRLACSLRSPVFWDVARKRLTNGYRIYPFTVLSGNSDLS